MDFVRFGTILFSNVLFLFMRCLDFLDVVRIANKHVRFYPFHQIPLLCDQQELACTPKDTPRRIDMKEFCLSILVRQVIELSTKPFENLLLPNHLKTAYVLLYHNKVNDMN